MTAWIRCSHPDCTTRSNEPHAHGWVTSRAWDGKYGAYCSRTCLELDLGDFHAIHFGINEECQITWRIVCADGCSVAQDISECECTIWEHYSGPPTNLHSGRRIRITRDEDDECWRWEYA